MAFSCQGTIHIAGHKLVTCGGEWPPKSYVLVCARAVSVIVILPHEQRWKDFPQGRFISFLLEHKRRAPIQDVNLSLALEARICKFNALSALCAAGHRKSTSAGFHGLFLTRNFQE